MKKFMTIFALLLVVTLVMNLAACGKSSEPDEPEVTPAPEYVYTAEYTALTNDDTVSMWPIAVTDKGFYVVSSEKVGEEIPEGVTPQYDGQYAVFEDTYILFDLEGNATPLDNFNMAEAPENTEGYDLYNSGSNVSAIFENEDGSLLVIENVYVSYYNGPEGLNQNSEDYWNYFHSENNYCLRHLNADGSEISSAAIDLGEDTYINGSSAAMDEKGNLVMSYNDRTGNWGLISMSLSGEIVYKAKVDRYVSSLIQLSDGRVAASGWGDTGIELKAIDSATGKFTDTFEIPNDAYDMISGGDEYDFYYTSGIKLYGYNLETGEKTQVLDWISCDVNSDGMNQIHIGKDGTIRGVVNRWRGSGANTQRTTELVVLSKVPYETVPQKARLTMAVQYLDYNVRDLVIDFNRSHDDVRIDVIDYSEYNTEDDWSAGRTKLTTEISAGNLPDILCLDGMPYTQLASKGLLEDLYPYLDADKELKREDLFENVLQAQEVDGGLYQVASSFQINTIVGAKSVVGDRSGWTYRDVMEALKKMPEGCDIFGYFETKDQVLQGSLAMSMDSFVDWSSGTCSFDSQEFLDMLEFANQFKLEVDDSGYDYSVDSDRARVSRGQQMLMSAYIYDFTDFQTYDYYFGGKGSAAYIGYPTSDGSSGSALSLGTGYGMSAACANKDAVWEFLRTFLSENNEIWGLPVNRKLFDEMKKEAMTPDYMTDEEGNVVLDENGEKIEFSHMSMSFGDGNTIEIYAMTQEEADQLEKLIQNTTKTIERDDQVTQLVAEEAQAYFNGQKSAEEVARLIQSKVNIYVNEQK